MVPYLKKQHQIPIFLYLDTKERPPPSSLIPKNYYGKKHNHKKKKHLRE